MLMILQTARRIANIRFGYTKGKKEEKENAESNDYGPSADSAQDRTDPKKGHRI